MIKMKVQELTTESFAPYGSFINLYEGYSDAEISFIPDRMLHFIGAPALDSLCSLKLKYRQLNLTETEYHENCEELFGGYAVDTIFHVGLLTPNGKPDLDSVKVFRLPAGYFCRVKRKVLHHAPFVVKPDQVAVGLVMLPPATYTIDCQVLKFEEPIPIEL